MCVVLLCRPELLHGNGVQGSTIGSLIKEIGWAKLFTNGLPLRIVMVGTLTGLQWGIYDAYKVRTFSLGNDFPSGYPIQARGIRQYGRDQCKDLRRSV